MSFHTHGWLVEITCVGAWRRVAVLDPVTGEEAVVHGPLDASDEALFALARRRLERRRRPAAAPPKRDGFFA
jgi:hypothetical protein